MAYRNVQVTTKLNSQKLTLRCCYVLLRSITTTLHSENCTKGLIFFLFLGEVFCIFSLSLSVSYIKRQ